MLSTPVLAQKNLLLTMLPVLAGIGSDPQGSDPPQIPDSSLPDEELPQTQTVTWQGLEWQRSDDGNKYTWDEARGYCDDLTLDGYEDWRLPGWEELKTLVVCSNGVQTPLEDYPGHPYYCGDGNESYNIPTIDSSFESHPWYYWSLTEANAAEAWAIHFGVGGANRGVSRTAGVYVRCVRDKGDFQQSGKGKL